jgi:hypothetical protein
MCAAKLCDQLTILLAGGPFIDPEGMARLSGAVPFIAMSKRVARILGPGNPRTLSGVFF